MELLCVIVLAVLVGAQAGCIWQYERTCRAYRFQLACLHQNLTTLPRPPLPPPYPHPHPPSW